MKQLQNKNEQNERKEKAISACLNQFVEKGLYETTSRDLSSALKLQSGGMYSYFANKDEAVIVCAEEAAFLLEKYLVEQALTDIGDPDRMLKELLDRAEKLSPMMRFFSQVCSVSKYREGIMPALTRLSEKYKQHALQLAGLLGCSAEDIEPYFYIFVTSVSNYMIFGERETVLPQLELAAKAIKKFLNNGGTDK